MSAKTIGSKRHKALIAMLIKERKAAGMNQTELAKALGQYQSFVARVESGERRVDVIEFLDLANAIGFDPKKAIAKLTAK
jgi:transcriptional regulator with XRE-family HTH domain